jgi:hypothetical protein
MGFKHPVWIQMVNNDNGGCKCGESLLLSESGERAVNSDYVPKLNERKFRARSRIHSWSEFNKR